MSLAGNTAERNANRDRFVAAFPAGSHFTLWTGSAPAATAAATGTQVVDITLPSSPWDVTTAGQASKAGTWSTTSTAAGAPGYGRLVSPDGTRIQQFVVGVDLTAPTVANTGDAYGVNTWTITFA